MTSSSRSKPPRSLSSEPLGVPRAASAVATLACARYSPAANSSGAALIESLASSAARAARRSSASATEASRWSQLLLDVMCAGAGGARAIAVAPLAGDIAIPARVVQLGPCLGHRAAGHRAERAGQRRGAEVDVPDDREGEQDEAAVVEHPGEI